MSKDYFRESELDYLTDAIDALVFAKIEEKKLKYVRAQRAELGYIHGDIKKMKGLFFWTKSQKKIEKRIADLEERFRQFSQAKITAAIRNRNNPAEYLRQLIIDQVERGRKFQQLAIMEQIKNHEHYSKAAPKSLVGRMMRRAFASRHGRDYGSMVVGGAAIASMGALAYLRYRDGAKDLLSGEFMTSGLFGAGAAHNLLGDMSASISSDALHDMKPKASVASLMGDATRLADLAPAAGEMYSSSSLTANKLADSANFMNVDKLGEFGTQANGQLNSLVRSPSDMMASTGMENVMMMTPSGGGGGGGATAYNPFAPMPESPASSSGGGGGSAAGGGSGGGGVDPLNPINNGNNASSGGSAGGSGNSNNGSTGSSGSGGSGSTGSGDIADNGNGSSDNNSSAGGSNNGSSGNASTGSGASGNNNASGSSGSGNMANNGSGSNANASNGGSNNSGNANSGSNTSGGGLVAGNNQNNNSTANSSNNNSGTNGSISGGGSGNANSGSNSTNAVVAGNNNSGNTSSGNSNNTGSATAAAVTPIVPAQGQNLAQTSPAANPNSSLTQSIQSQNIQSIAAEARAAAVHAAAPLLNPMQSSLTLASANSVSPTANSANPNITNPSSTTATGVSANSAASASTNTSSTSSTSLTAAAVTSSSTTSTSSPTSTTIPTSSSSNTTSTTQAPEAPKMADAGTGRGANVVNFPADGGKSPSSSSPEAAVKPEYVAKLEQKYSHLSEEARDSRISERKADYQANVKPYEGKPDFNDKRTEFLSRQDKIDAERGLVREQSREVAFNPGGGEAGGNSPAIKPPAPVEQPAAEAPVPVKAVASATTAEPPAQTQLPKEALVAANEIGANLPKPVDNPSAVIGELPTQRPELTQPAPQIDGPVPV